MTQSNSITSQSLDPLGQLRDIHLPQPISWWPLAPGWYGLLALVVIVVILVGFYLFRRYQKRAIQRLALRQLANLQQLYQGQTGRQTAGEQIAMELSKLLRRVALSYYPREQVAHLQGQAWLAFLDKTSPQPKFNKQGQVLVTAPYQKYVDDDLTILFTLCETWIKYQHV